MEDSLVKRLEVAVSRLEAISSQKPNLAPKPTSNGGTSGTQLLASNEVPESVRTYDDHMDEPLKAFFSHCTAIGGDLAEASSKLRIVFDLHRNFLWSAAGQAEPSDATALQSKLSPVLTQVQNFTSFKDSKKTSPQFQHLAAIAEGMPAVFWVTVKKTPAPYVKEISDASMFYINRVRKDNKGNQVHLDWANALIEVFNALQKYIRQVHTTGLVWNSAPGAVPADGPQTAAKAAPAKAGGPPPPPPPPPAGLFAETKPSDSGTKNVREALFAEINKGDAITSGLKKVTADMQTHKNPTLRVQNAPVPGSKPNVTPKPGGTKVAPATERPPKTELKDRKVWNVEYHKNNEGIVIETDKKQAAYIYKCENSVVQIKGKVNSVTIDSCKKSSVVFENLLAQIEVINCQSIKVQTLGTLPTISIQKTDGCQVYLSNDSLNAEIVTSKSSEMNVLAPIGDDGDFVEFPIPEQFKTTLCAKTKKLTTVASDIV